MERKLLLLATILFGCLVCCSELVQAETMTLTTYYPAPYGVYKDFEVKKSVALGDIATNGPMDYSGGVGTQIQEVADLGDGELWVEDSVIFEPKDAFDPSTADAGKEGELVYASSDDNFYYFNGSDWLVQGGGGGGRMVATLIGAQGANPPTCDASAGWEEVTTGFWSCPVFFQDTVDGVTFITGAGNCFCSGGSSHTFSLDTTKHNKYSSIFFPPAGPAQMTRCTICVK